MSVALMLCAALAADPWGRPEHLRVVAAPPERWGDRASTRRPVRVFWDDTGVSATVAVWTGRGWSELTDDAAPGFETPPVPDGTPVRVRLEDAARWSPSVVALPLTTPAALAALAAPGPVLLGDTVGEVSPLEDASGAWVATLGGGAAWVDARLQPQPLTMWEGLPDERVVSIHADGERVLLGTAAGAALVEDGRVQRVFDDELPHTHVQAVRLDGERMWLGTYRGLARVEGGRVDVVLQPWSVFSVAPATEGEVWVGYEGARRIPVDAPPVSADATAEPPPGWLPDDRVFGFVDSGRGVLVAGREAGVRMLRPDGSDAAVPGLPTVGAFGITLGPGGPWVAAGALGLVGPAGQVWGTATGLAGDTVYAVAADAAGALWVGTDAGLGRVWAAASGPPGLGPIRTDVVPRSPLPAGRPGTDLLVGEAGAWVAGADGVRVLGQPHPHGGDLVVAAGDRVTALVQAPGAVWALGRRAVRLDAEGRLHHVRIPAPVVDAAWAGNALWGGGPDGLLQYVPQEDRFVTTHPLPGVTRVAPGDAGPWVISRGAVFHVKADGLRPHLQTGTALDLAPDDERVWIGSAEGLEVLHRHGPRAGEVERMVSGAAVPAVASDGAGGCWFVAEDGTVGRVDEDGASRTTALPGLEPGAPTRVVADGPGAAFVLTESGLWHVRLPAVDGATARRTGRQ